MPLSGVRPSGSSTCRPPGSLRKHTSPTNCTLYGMTSPLDCSATDDLHGRPDCGGRRAAVNGLQLGSAKGLGRGNTSGELTVKPREESGGLRVIDRPERAKDARHAAAEKGAGHADRPFFAALFAARGAAGRQ